MLKTVICLISGCCLLILAAAPLPIGTIRSNGEFRVDGAVIGDNGTLFEGSIVETASARSVLQLGKLQLTLLPMSRAKIYRGRTVLEKGSELVSGAEKHVVEAFGMRIAASTATSSVQVQIPAPGRVDVAARDGGAEVHNSSGILVASLRAGMSLAFEPQENPKTVKIAGTVVAANGRLFVVDITTNVTVELVGADLEKYVGKKVQISGEIVVDAKPLAPATQVVRVSSAKIAGAAGATGRAAGAAGGAAGAASTAVGISGAAIGAIVGGVAVSGTVIGLAAAGTFSGDSSASRK